jgi:IS5 family transposase
MALGTAQVQQRFDNPREILGDRLREGSIYRLLADEGQRLFPDEYFADLHKASALGRPTVPARILATVMVLQAFEGLSDREACDRLEVDLRWQAAAGVDVGTEAFHPTVLVGHRNRLRGSARPRRLFEDTRAVARAAGALKGRARVLDSTPVYDAVATQDTVTQLRAAIRKVLVVLDTTDPVLATRVRAALSRDDDYASAGKPPCDWDDPAAREALVDDLVHDALAALAVLDGEELTPVARDAADLLALVAGQDVAQGDDGVFRIVRGTARDRVISTVDPEARHGHKSHNRRFDGYKAHTSVDPDSELIDEVVVTPANAPDRDAVDDLLATHADSGDKPSVVGDSAYADGAPGPASKRGLRGDGQDASGAQLHGAVAEGPLRRRPRRRHGPMPRRPHRGHRLRSPRRRQGQLRSPLRHLPAAGGLHRLAPGPHHHRPPPRGGPPAGPSRAAIAGVVGPLPGRPSRRGAQDRPPGASGVGRPQGTEAWAPSSSNRHRHPSWRHQPGASGRARSQLRRHRLGRRR